MSNEKQKSENYVQMGGINILVSPYDTGPTEFLDLVNFDFQIPGSLQKRWGTTAYFGQTLNSKINNIFEFERISGLSQVIVAGQTFYKNNGVNLTALDIGPDAYGWSFFVAGHNVDMKTFVDQMWAVNAQSQFRYEGNSLYFAQIPSTSTHNLSFSYGGSGANYPGFTAAFFYEICYINNRGGLGPSVRSLPYAGATISNVLSINVTGATSINFGISCSNSASFLSLFGITYVAVFRSVRSFAGNEPDLPSSFANNDLEYLMIGTCTIGGTFVDTALPLGLTALPTSMHFYQRAVDLLMPSLAPKYMEIYNNQLFVTGDTSTPSTVYFSDLVEPESFQPDSNFEVRSNDGTVVTALKAFHGALYIFKENSFSILSGTDPTSFSLREVSSDYGCISSKAVIVYDNFMMFLDKNAVVMYNGANIQVISHPIDPVMKLMNINAAKDQACMVHDKERNQVLIAIPYNGSAVNNLVLVYDYLLKAWTKYEGLKPSALASIKGRLSEKTVVLGGYTGLVSNFGASFTSDNGVGFTTLLKTRFIKPMGDSVQKQFRRLYLNVDALSGPTSVLNVEFFTDYASSASLVRTMFQDQFQSRIDFGSSAKSLAIQVSNFSSTDTIRLHGYTIEFRFQRMT